MNAIRQAEAGTPVGNVCRQFGVSAATFCAWNKQNAHLSMNELWSLRQLEEKNRRLKRLFADLSLDKYMQSERPCTKSLRLACCGKVVHWFQTTFQMRCAHACRLCNSVGRQACQSVMGPLLVAVLQPLRTDLFHLVQ